MSEAASAVMARYGSAVAIRTTLLKSISDGGLTYVLARVVGRGAVHPLPGTFFRGIR